MAVRYEVGSKSAERYGAAPGRDRFRKLLKIARSNPDEWRELSFWRGKGRTRPVSASEGGKS